MISKSFLPATPGNTVLVWLRRDLRLSDHAALAHALTTGKRICVGFVFDRDILADLPAQDRRVTFIHEAVSDIAARLRELGGELLVAHDHPVNAIAQWVKDHSASEVIAAADHEPQAYSRDEKVAEALQALGAQLTMVTDHTLHRPGDLLTGSGRPYTVFTPFKRTFLREMNATAWQAREVDPEQLAHRLVRPRTAGAMPSLASLGFEGCDLAALGVHGGESAGASLLDDFAGRIARYDETRDFPGVRGPSYLSVHLRFGTVSIRQAARLADRAIAGKPALNKGAATWQSELIWRDFYFQVLHHFPHVVSGAFRPEFDRIEWVDDSARFDAWCQGRTGYPLIDAAMAQINQTGYMHNRLRMVTASFLSKDLGIHWQLGEQYFARQLIDFDLAANNGGWQWAASTGCDAQPWFRIFNPVTQSQRFDPRGKFIRRYLPALAELSDKAIHAPWLLDDATLRNAGIELGRNYPRPIVAHDEARKDTLARYGVVKD